jgi:hypothetical protein
MPEPDLIELFVGPLQSAGIRYIISGSVAAMLYGEPRVTHDIDLVVFLRTDDIAKLPQLFPRPEFYVPPPEVIAAEMARLQHGCFNVIHADTSLKADFFTASRDEFHAWAFRHLKRYLACGMEVTLAPPEYVIVRKLEYFREGGSDKHLRDIRGMLSVSGERIDRAELLAWVQRQGVEAEWRKVTES